MDVPIGWHASSTGAWPRSPRGVGPDYLVTLEVPGRRSGRIVRLPLVAAVVDGERYLVPTLGEETNSVRNVRAAGGDVALVHGRREDVHLEEVAPDRRARGLSNGEIADVLAISRHTVANHVATILRKLNLPSRSRLAVWVAERNLGDPG